mmetsp:Transcript_64699/g.118082  ORF Transcript_64699/g.118082 Transcript_64699/m.118082 type:complete len:80 (+) Transcript_64699:3-242(+)
MKQQQKEAAMAAERNELVKNLFGVNMSQSSAIGRGCPMRPEEGLMMMEMAEQASRALAGGQCRGGKQSSSEPATQGLRH